MIPLDPDVIVTTDIPTGTNLVGVTFRNLIVIGRTVEEVDLRRPNDPIHEPSKRDRRWVCRCTCGNLIGLPGESIRKWAAVPACVRSLNVGCDDCSNTFRESLSQDEHNSIKLEWKNALREVGIRNAMANGARYTRKEPKPKIPKTVISKRVPKVKLDPITKIKTINSKNTIRSKLSESLNRGYPDREDIRSKYADIAHRISNDLGICSPKVVAPTIAPERIALKIRDEAERRLPSRPRKRGTVTRLSIREKISLIPIIEGFRLTIGEVDHGIFTNTAAAMKYVLDHKKVHVTPIKKHILPQKPVQSNSSYKGIFSNKAHRERLSHLYSDTTIPLGDIAREFGLTIPGIINVAKIFLFKRNFAGNMNPHAATVGNLAAELHPTKNINRNHLTGALWWVCQEGHQFETTAQKRRSGNGCPTCWKETMSWSRSSEGADWFRSYGFECDNMSDRSLDQILTEAVAKIREL